MNNGLKHRKTFAVTVIIVQLLVVTCSAVAFVSAQSGLVVFINSDTTWTKANSPYSLTGPTVVNVGVTLTINSGVTVNLNDYTLLVNGTLRAVGTSADNIYINGDNITVGAGASDNSILENVVTNAQITSPKQLTLNNDTLSNLVSVGDSSAITNNVVTANINVGNFGTISRNTISGDINSGNSTQFLGNSIIGDITSGTSTTFSGNFVNGSKIVHSGIGSMGYYHATALTVGNFSVISNNAIDGGVIANWSNVSNNTISGGGPFTDWVGRSEDSSSALEISGSSTVTSNVIYSATGGYGLLVWQGHYYQEHQTENATGNTIVTASNNYINNTVRIAANAVVDGNFITGGLQVGEVFVLAFNDVGYGYGDAVIENNVIDGGIRSSYVGGSATIQNNLITDAINGISICSQATIQNNTISNAQTAIVLTNTSPLINFNNIIGFSQNSVLLTNNPLAVNATNDWWGTSDTQAIGLSIHDFKYDLDLGTVNFTPILYSSNTQAPATTYSIQQPNPPSLSQQVIAPTPTPITSPQSSTLTTYPPTTPTPSVPEFPAIVIVPLLLSMFAVAAIVRHRKVKHG